jgi:hypothetical protein
MSLRMIANNEPGTSREGPRILAPGAPPSPGPIPNDLAAHLRFGEVLVWWNSKETIALGPIAVALSAALLALGLVSGFAPEIWRNPVSGLGPPLLVLLSPTLFVLAREWAGRRAVLVTDDAIIDVDHEGASQRIGLSAIYRVRRDWLRGGVRLEGPDGRVRIPPILLDDARRAVASRLRGRVRGSTQVDDSTGFWP